MPDIPDSHIRALRALTERLKGQKGLVWALTGSASFALQGMDIPVNDIDVAADRDSALRIGALLEDCCIKPVEADSAARYVRSYYGQFRLEGVDVDLMGDSRRMDLDGSWTEPAFLPPLIEWVSVSSLRLPVLSLAFEEQAYRLLRRDERADAIAGFLRGKEKAK